MASTWTPDPTFYPSPRAAAKASWWYRPRTSEPALAPVLSRATSLVHPFAIEATGSNDRLLHIIVVAFTRSVAAAYGR